MYGPAGGRRESRLEAVVLVRVYIPVPGCPAKPPWGGGEAWRGFTGIRPAPSIEFLAGTVVVVAFGPSTSKLANSGSLSGAFPAVVGETGLGLRGEKVPRGAPVAVRSAFSAMRFLL